MEQRQLSKSGRELEEGKEGIFSGLDGLCEKKLDLIVAVRENVVQGLGRLQAYGLPPERGGQH